MLNDSQDIILSVVIPTRNRIDCAKYCVLSALKATSESEIVILDSGDDDQLISILENVVGKAEDFKRIQYYKTSKSLNVVENFEAGIEYCKGTYITYLGDDDLIGPNIESICRCAEINGVDSITSYGLKFGVAYYWPGVKSKYFGDAYDSKVFVWSMSGEHHLIDVNKEMDLTKSNIGFGLAKLPRIYHGLVSRDLVNKVISKHGKLFGGVSPDIYSAVLLSLNCEKPMFIDYPVCVPGASAKSEAGSGAARTDRQGFYDSAYLSRFKDLEWDELVPMFFSPYNVWGFSMAEAYKKSGNEMEPDFYCRLYVRCFLYCFSYRKETLLAYRRFSQKYGKVNSALMMIKSISREITHFSLRIVSKLSSPKAGGKAKRYCNINNSMEAYNLLSEITKKDPLKCSGSNLI